MEASSKPPKWKNGLPTEMKSFIKQKILETRPRDTDVVLNIQYVKEASLKDQLLEFEIKDPLVSLSASAPNSSLLESQVLQCWCIIL
jgi:hypothetical protein